MVVGLKDWLIHWLITNTPCLLLFTNQNKMESGAFNQLYFTAKIANKYWCDHSISRNKKISSVMVFKNLHKVAMPLPSIRPVCMAFLYALKMLAFESFLCIIVIILYPWFGNEWINCKISLADLNGLSRVIACPHLSRIWTLQFFTFSAMISAAETSRIWSK